MMPKKDANSPEIIERIYDVAVDPARLEELVDVWEERIAPLRMQGNVLDENSDTTFAHFSRMGLFLDRLQFTEPHDLINEVSEAGALGAIVVSADLKVQQVNASAHSLFGLQNGDLLSGVSPNIASQDALNHAIEKAIDKPDMPPEFLRFRREGSERFIILRVRGIKKTDAITGKQQNLALIVTSELAWQPNFGEAIQSAFDLTSSEVEIIRALIEGYTIDAIAKSRKRAKATVRTQIHSIFEKTETRSQTELVRISLSLMDMVMFSEKTAVNLSDNLERKPQLEPTVFHSITRPKNRRLDHVILGDPDGTPLLYLPGDYGLIRWTASAEAETKLRGIKVIVPVRAGFGHSALLPKKANYLDLMMDDFSALLDHHNVAACPIISQAGDFCFATIFAARNPDRVSAIIALAPLMPMWKREQYERMDKWYKFIVANARYAPKILPYLVKAGFYLALTIGLRGFMSSIYSDNQADQDTYADPEVYEALATGTGAVTLSKQHTAHEAFAHETILQADPNWAADLEFLKGKVPIHAHLGMSSPMTPKETLVEYQERYDWVEFHLKPNAGELLFFKYWRDILDFTQDFLKTD